MTFCAHARYKHLKFTHGERKRAFSSRKSPRFLCFVYYHSCVYEFDDRITLAVHVRAAFLPINLLDSVFLFSYTNREKEIGMQRCFKTIEQIVRCIFLNEAHTQQQR